VLESKQLRYRKCVDPGVAEGAKDFSPPPADVPRADTAGLGPEGDTVDRPGPTAPIEIPREQAEAETKARPEAEQSDQNGGQDAPRGNTR
jgi:hypothetical protein